MPSVPGTHGIFVGKLIVVPYLKDLRVNVEKVGPKVLETLKLGRVSMSHYSRDIKNRKKGLLGYTYVYDLGCDACLLV